MKTTRPVNKWLAALLVFAFGSFLPQAALAQEVKTEEAEVVVGAQGVSVDADEDRDAKFELNREIPKGFVLDYFNWAKWSLDGTGYAQVRSTDALQRDQQLNFRGGWMGKLDVAVDWNRSPHRYGDGAVFIPGRVSDDFYPVPDFIQQTLEDPDGNGIPFYEEPGGVSGDNTLAAGLMNQLVDASGTFDLATLRDEGALSFVASPTPDWKFNFNLSREYRDGLRPASTGTYQRLRDGYDYWFSVRGQELPATVDYVTTVTDVSAAWANGKWFAQGGVRLLGFDNGILGITYDSPYWYTDTLANAGVKRGLWGTGRTSLPPSNDSWNVFFTGGATLARNTQITATVDRGKISQNDSFLPVTTNTALIGTADINGDGVINEADDPTTTSTLLRSGLDAKVDTTVFNLVLTSRPHQRLKLTGRIRTYDYDSTQSLFNSGFRAEYLESRIKPDFHKAPLNHVPVDFQRNHYSAEGVIRAAKAVKVVVFGKWMDRGYDQYVDTDHSSYVSRTAGTRAVSGTLDTRLGAGLVFGTMGWFNGQITYEHASQNFDGTYRPGYDGEIEGMRQYDIANRDRNSLLANLNFTPMDRTTFGVRLRYNDDDYSESVYGLQKGKETGIVFDVNTAPHQAFNLFAYLEWSKYEADSHLRTKCSNCTAPPGADWSPPWEVPNFDWFSDYTDSTVAVGAGLVHEGTSHPYTFDLKTNYVKGTVEQLNRNPAPPMDLLRGTPVQVALAVPFPDQDTKTFMVDARFDWKVSEIATVGVWYLFEKFDLGDFMWDPMDPYGYNYLEIDDATRYLFLDARYTSYTANVLQVFLKLAF